MEVSFNKGQSNTSWRYTNQSVVYNILAQNLQDTGYLDAAFENDPWKLWV